MFLASGEKLRPLRNYEQRLERLKDLEFLLSAEHQKKLWSLKEQDCNAAAADFVRAFVDMAARHGIPLYCRRAVGGHVEIVHAQYEDRLGDDDWVILGQIGSEVIASSLIKARWGADEGCSPVLWLVEDWMSREE